MLGLGEDQLLAVSDEIKKSIRELQEELELYTRFLSKNKETSKKTPVAATTAVPPAEGFKIDGYKLNSNCFFL